MLSLNFQSPKSLLSRVIDVFQGNHWFGNQEVSEEDDAQEENPAPTKSKLNISLDDLKTVSTALLHYRRSLAKKGETQRAEGVARIDEQFYLVINQLETHYKAFQNESALA